MRPRSIRRPSCCGRTGGQVGRALRLVGRALVLGGAVAAWSLLASASPRHEASRPSDPRLFPNTGRGERQPARVELRVDQLFEEFFAEDSPRELARVSERIVREGVSFVDAFGRLEAGRRYKRNADTGEVRWISPYSPRVGVRTIVLIPRDYDPALPYPVRIQLHGGVGGDDPPGQGPRRRNDPRLSTRLESSRATIHVLPAGFAAAQWWFANQVDNLRWIVDRLKRSYNIDENHVHVLGVSDGATGTLFLGMRETTPWSSFVALNGHPRVLTNATLGVDGELFASNLANKPLYLVNGGRDPQYPADTVTPFVDLFRRAGADVTFRIKPAAAHDTSWWDEEQFDIDDFVDESRRDPLPSTLTWETERVDRYNRAHWLVITRLSATQHGEVPGDVNELRLDGASDFGLRIDLKVVSGRRVVDVIKGTDADRMGLRKGDTIVQIDGVRLRDGRQIVEAIAGHAADRPLDFLIERDGRRTVLSSPFPPASSQTIVEQAFPRAMPSGRVDLEQRGNRVEARTRGVAAFTLLLSPRRFDFSEPVVVVVNGREVVNRVFTPDVATLLEWAAIDNDRTMLFGVELPIEVVP